MESDSSVMQNRVGVSRLVGRTGPVLRVQNQDQVLKGKKDAVALVRAGILDFASFEREFEAVLVPVDTAILMGLETVKPRNKAPDAEQTVRRRFTNIWMKRDGRWQFTARQMTIIGRD
jgi:hypothetical protein